MARAADAGRRQREPFDDPESYLAEDRRRALAAETPLPQRGAEELTAVLDLIFEAVLQELHDRGGAVLYFSGDAVTCWLDGDDGLLATAWCAGSPSTCR